MPTQQSPYPSVLAIFFVLLSSLDLIFTLLLGPECEANPLAILIWRDRGPLGLFGAKVAVVAGILGLTGLTGVETAGRILSFGIGAEIVALIALLYFWWHMPKVAF